MMLEPLIARFRIEGLHGDRIEIFGGIFNLDRKNVFRLRLLLPFGGEILPSADDAVEAVAIRFDLRVKIPFFSLSFDFLKDFIGFF